MRFDPPKGEVTPPSSDVPADDQAEAEELTTTNEEDERDNE